MLTTRRLVTLCNSGNTATIGSVRGDIQSSNIADAAGEIRLVKDFFKLAISEHESKYTSNIDFTSVEDVNFTFRIPEILYTEEIVRDEFSFRVKFGDAEHDKGD